MAQKTFLPTKSPFKSKLNWLFVVLGTITASPEAIEALNNASNNLALPALSIAGIVLRTFFTSSKLTH